LIYKQLEHQEKEFKLNETIKRSEVQENNKKNYLINKLDKINERIEKKKLDNQNENIMRFECISLKREECSINVTRKERIQEHIREEKMINIHQKMKKLMN